jgi:HD-like signal output (HDOD) protein
MQHTQNMEQRALGTVREHFKLNALKLPSLSEVTAQVRAIAGNPRATAENLASAILRDPALTARLIRIANSPLLRGRMEVRSLAQAITRLGFHYVRDISTALALEHAFEPESANAQQLMRRLARRSREVAAISHVLARHCTMLPPEQALLAGLLHFIGALPLLVAVTDDGAEQAAVPEIFALLQSHHAEIGVKLLRHWHFPEEIASVPLSYRDNGRDPEAGADYGDIVAVANLLADTLDGAGAAVPELEAFQPARKLGLESARAFYDSEPMQDDLRQSMSLFN